MHKIQSVCCWDSFGELKNVMNEYRYNSCSFF